MNDIELVKRIYMKKKPDEFAAFQDSRGTRRAYLAETAETTFNGKNDKGELGLALEAPAQSSMIDIIRMIFIPL
jgi:hypothetical protein